MAKSSGVPGRIAVYPCSRVLKVLRLLPSCWRGLRCLPILTFLAFLASSSLVLGRLAASRLARLGFFGASVSFFVFVSFWARVGASVRGAIEGKRSFK